MAFLVNLGDELPIFCLRKWAPPKVPPMLALHRARLRTTHTLTVASSLSHYQNASIATRRFFVQSVCNGFLDLATALPLPPSLPPYSTTIIFVTVISRFALLPISIWVRVFLPRLHHPATEVFFIYDRGNEGHNEQRKLWCQRLRNLNLLLQNASLRTWRKQEWEETRRRCKSITLKNQ